VSPRVLIATKDSRLRRALAKALSTRLDVVTCETEEAALALTRTGRPDAALADSVLATHTLREALAPAPLVLANVLEPSSLHDGVVAALPFGTEPDLLAFAIEQAVEVAMLRARAARAEARVGSELGEIVVASKAMRTLVAKARRAAQASTNVLVTGEPGTGKELLARVALGGLGAPVVDPALGHERAGVELRALLDSDADEASARALLLHVDALEPEAQSLLRAAIEAHRTPKLVATGTADLRKDPRFDKLLYLRLAGVLLEVPPLRTRCDDIPVLATLFLKRQPRGAEARIGPAAMRALRGHDWRGNVAELEAVIIQAAASMKGDTIGPGDLPFIASRAHSHPLADVPYADARARATNEFERAYVREMLERTGGNYTQAARLAGMDRANFRRLVKRISPR
jgi:DNA-binding NtrC family response regulator